MPDDPSTDRSQPDAGQLSHITATFEDARREASRRFLVDRHQALCGSYYKRKALSSEKASQELIQEAKAETKRMRARFRRAYLRLQYEQPRKFHDMLTAVVNESVLRDIFLNDALSPASKLAEYRDNVIDLAYALAREAETGRPEEEAVANAANQGGAAFVFEEKHIMETLRDNQHRTFTVEAIADKARISLKTVKKYLPGLIDNGFVHRPKGKNKGCAATDKGLRVIGPKQALQ